MCGCSGAYLRTISRAVYERVGLDQGDSGLWDQRFPDLQLPGDRTDPDYYLADPSVAFLRAQNRGYSPAQVILFLSGAAAETS